MRIAFFLPSLGGGGAEASTVRLAAELARRGHRVDLVTARSGRAPNHVLVDGVQQVELGARRTRGALLALRRHLRHDPPDVLVTIMDHANVVGLLAAASSRTGVPVVASFRTDTVAAAARSQHPFAKVRVRVARWTVDRADRTVAVSEGARDALLSILPRHPERVSAIYNPTVHPDLRAAGAEEPTAVPEGVDLAESVLAVGRLSPAKGFDVLLDAFARLGEADAQRHLVVLGEGPERGALERQAAALGIADRVHLVGFVANPAAFMARCPLLVLSSRWEGLPTVLVEAGSLGCRLVATDCRSGPRELLEGRPQATLVPVDDVDALAGAIGDALAAGRPTEAGDWGAHAAGTIGDRYEALLQAVGAR